MVDVVTVGHILADIRIIVDEFSTPDRESKVIGISRGAGGSAANTAVGIVKLGKSASLIGKVGMDSFGKLSLDEIMHSGVDVSNVKVDFKHPTGFTIVIINKRGEIVMYGFKGASEKLTPREISKRVIAKSSHVHITGLRMDTAFKAAKTAKKLGKTVTWDPGRLVHKFRIEDVNSMLKNIDYVLLNEKEICSLTKLGDYRKAAKMLLKYDIKGVIVKRGRKGVYALTRSEEIEVPAYSVKAVDTTGAGDAFAAGFIASILDGKPVNEAIEYGNLVAAIKVTRLGAQVSPTKNEVEEYSSKLKKSLV